MKNLKTFAIAMCEKATRIAKSAVKSVCAVGVAVVVGLSATPAMATDSDTVIALKDVATTVKTDVTTLIVPVLAIAVILLVLRIGWSMFKKAK